MSNILIIKHGSLGDLIQANGVIQDIKSHHKNTKVLLLTSSLYANFMSGCPYIDGVLIDKRLPRWNLLYLINLRRMLLKYNFVKIYDLQNSSRTRFYKKFLLKNINWSSSDTSLEKGQTKKEFDNFSVLDRFETQLKKNQIKIENTKNINLTWAVLDIKRLIKQYTNNEYILIFPFCSKKHEIKKWPYFKDLILKLRELYKEKYSILAVPGPGEIEEAKRLGIKCVLSDDGPVDINHLISLIYYSKFIISNDTGPAHICSHLKKKGLALFGSHTTAQKVNVGNNYFKTLEVEHLVNLKVNQVLENIKKNLD